MQSEQVWLDDELASGAPSVTRRGVLAGSLKLLGGGALALTVTGAAGTGRLAFAQDDSTPEAEAEGEAAGEIQVGTTDDAAGDTAAEGEAEVAAGAELPADAAAGGEDEQTREERRAARQAEEGVGGTAVTTAPSTGVGALGSSLGGVIGAIGLAAATGAAAFFTRRGATRHEGEAE